MQGWEGLLPGRWGTVDVMMSIARSGLPPGVVGVILLFKGKRNGKGHVGVQDTSPCVL